MPSLVLEGGAFRTLFSAGVLDCLLDNNIIFPYCIGVSGGATNCISYIFPAIEINQNFYYDCAICYPIPIRKAINDGNKKHLIIITRSKGHIEPLSKADITLSKLLSRKYPLLKAPLIERYNIYNDDIKLCEELESNGDAIIIHLTQYLKLVASKKYY